ncbi:hypothetical protein PF007_g5083 [Phytophthora fragariae]|uniref:Uncharacterized protein n=1 Tax=Phytophthora fragariae TaxID=53985 RepID=A0A6A3T3K3_9STRA|nr:hypothetical protein PF007_g5083 [Phytophthora fragariae]
MRYSALSGSLGAVAGLLGKLGADGDSNALQLLENQCAASSLSESCDVLTSIGLHETDSLTATVTSSAVSCVLSAAGGYFFFQELLPTRWFVGAAVIVVGLAFLLHGDKAEDKTKED